MDTQLNDGSILHIPDEVVEAAKIVEEYFNQINEYWCFRGICTRKFHELYLREADINNRIELAIKHARESL